VRKTDGKVNGWIMRNRNEAAANQLQSQKCLIFMSANGNSKKHLKNSLQFQNYFTPLQRKEVSNTLYEQHSSHTKTGKNKQRKMKTTGKSTKGKFSQQNAYTMNP
jgi:hypothetical protein